MERLAKMHPERDWGFLRTYQSSEVSEELLKRPGGKCCCLRRSASLCTITQLHNFSTKASTDKQQAWLFSNKTLFTNTDTRLDSAHGQGSPTADTV